MDLKNIYIFGWLNEEELSYFEFISKEKIFKKWEIIIKEWDDCNDSAYIIESGSVEVFHKGEKLSTIGEWDIFWEIALIVNEPRLATVIASEDTKVLVFQKEDFLMLYKKSGNYEEIKEKILHRIKNTFYWVKE